VRVEKEFLRRNHKLRLIGIKDSKINALFVARNPG